MQKIYPHKQNIMPAKKTFSPVIIASVIIWAVVITLFFYVGTAP